MLKIIHIFLSLIINRISFSVLSLVQIEKRAVVKDKGDKQDTKRTRTKWITDFIIITEFNKIVLGSG